jgi:hypothetical protein
LLPSNQHGFLDTDPVDLRDCFYHRHGCATVSTPHFRTRPWIIPTAAP